MSITERIYALLADISGLSLFMGLKGNPVIRSLKDLLEELLNGQMEDEFGASGVGLDTALYWAAFTAAFVESSCDYSFYITVAHLTATDDNIFTRTAERQDVLPPLLLAMAKTDLERLGRIAAFEIHSLGFHIAENLRQDGLEAQAQSIEEESRVLWAAEGKKNLSEKYSSLLRLFPEQANWGNLTAPLAEYIRARGAGALGLFSSFVFVPPSPKDAYKSRAPGFLSLTLRPIHNPDSIRLSSLYGYEAQRGIIIANTKRFIEGKQVNNLLLYGDRGTGKSASVKAVCNEFAHRGLKLVEISKNDIRYLPGMMEGFRNRAGRFILFIDDLSFENADDSFRHLKIILDGGMEVRPPNVAVYAASHRRHLLKEAVADRPTSAMAASGDVRAFDTMQEQFSLADRFGLTIVFSAPSQEEYLAIAQYIAEQRGLPLSRDEETLKAFRDNALRWERWFNGRSPRTAIQYVDWISGAENLETEKREWGVNFSGVRFPWDQERPATP